MAGNGQTLDPQSRCIGAIAEREVVCRRQAGEHVEEVPGNRDLADRIGTLTVLDPESRHTATVVSRHQVDPHPDHVGDVKTVGNVGDELLRALPAGGGMKIARAGRGGRGNAALRMTGGCKIELARGGAIEQPGREYAVVDQFAAAAGDAFGVERSRTQAARPQWIVDDVDARGKNLLTKFFPQETRLTGDGGAVGGA